LSSVDVIDVMIYGSISVITDLIVDMCYLGTRSYVKGDSTELHAHS